jgi:aspartyl-tRNA(Asn)/glutamyl-tRNA(Gln) amidotransferase subunit B
MRSKEEAHDYRYFPDPDLTPLHVSEERMKRAGSTMPELPAQKRARFSEQYALTPADVEILTETKSLADFFEQTAQFSREPKLTANWILRDVLNKLKEHAKIIDESNISAEHLAGLIKAIANGTISGNQGKEVFEEMWDSGESAAEIIGRKGISQISGEVEIGRIVDSVLAENPEIAERYRKGELKLHGVLVGLVMKASGGKANPSLVSRLIQKTSS